MDQQARTDERDHDEGGSRKRRQNFVVAGRRGTRGNPFDKNAGAYRPDAEHVSAGLLRSAPQPGEQQNQEDDRGEQRKRSGRQRRVAQRRPGKQKADSGQDNWPVQRAGISVGLSEEGRADLVCKLDAPRRETDLAIRLDQEAGSHQLLALGGELPGG
jgi:hypothetical protein